MVVTFFFVLFFSVSQIVVDFTATWCGPCRLMAPIFTELSKKYDQIIFIKLDVDEVQVIDPLYKRRNVHHLFLNIHTFEIRVDHRSC